MEWLCHPLAASRPQAILLQQEVLPPHLYRAAARPGGALGAADAALGGTPLGHGPRPGWSSWGTAEPALRPDGKSPHALTDDPPHALPRDQSPSGPQRR